MFQRRCSDKAELTASIILNVQWDGFDRQDVHHGDGFVRPYLGDSDGWRFIVVFAHYTVHRDSVSCRHPMG